MKILLTSFGTRGDVQPSLALAVGLKKAGHHPTVSTSYNYSAWIESYGVQTYPTSFSMQEAMKTPEAQAILKSKNIVRQIGMLRDFFRKTSESQNEVWNAIQETDYVIQSPAGSGALEAVSKLHIPAAFSTPVPFAPTRAFPSFFLGGMRASLGGAYNRLTHTLMHQMLWSMMGGQLTNPLRKKLGLKPWRSFGEVLAQSRKVGVPWLCGFSPHIIHPPTDWDKNQHITGFWFLDAPSDWSPPHDLLQFLETGPPPVYIGFGSMSEDAERITRIALRALELSGQRGLLSTGWGGLTAQNTPENVFVVDEVPHDWLFPRMAAVLHHGGAGTSAAGLRAGIPNLITPFGPNDQPSWANVMVKLGVGPQLPGIRKATAEILAEAIKTAINDTSMRARTAALGEKIRAEDGVARAVEIIEQHAAIHQLSSH